MNSTGGGLPVESSCFTSCTLEPEYTHAALAPLEDHQRNDDSQPVEYVG
jgi:hypothetical protein